MDETEKQKHTNSCMDELVEILKTPLRNPEEVMAALFGGIMICCTSSDKVTSEGAWKVLSIAICDHPKATELLLLMKRFLRAE